MNKKVLTMGLMATFVAAALSGCVQEDQAEVLSVTSVDQCIASGIDFNTCNGEWERAKSMHESVAPKFDSASSCMGEFGDMCQNRQVYNSDGTTSNVWLPMMAGMMMGNMMANNTHPVNTRPLYMSGAKRTPHGTFVGTLNTPSGNAVSPGVSRMSPAAAASTPKPASVASTRAAVSSRGGFGSSARGGSGAS